MKTIARGAEAIIELEGSSVIKSRIPKSYRLKQLDDRLRSTRTKREANILEKLAKISFPSPRLKKIDEKHAKLDMDFIDGEKVRDMLEQSDYLKICSEIGRKIALMHNNDIIHGDLTTSNMIWHKKGKKFEVYFVDFGLSFLSERIEDRAVDLHLFRQALESKHYRIWEKAYKSALDGYKSEAKKAEEILKRLEIVERRGRYKQGS